MMTDPADQQEWDEEPEWPPFPPADDVAEEGQRTTNPTLVDYIADELLVPTEVAEFLAPKFADRIAYERTTSLARRYVRDEQLARDADFAGIDVVTAGALLARERPRRARVFGDLVMAGHNVTVVARYKTGKSTLAENMVWAATTGNDFLGRYPITAPMQVAYMNYELDELDMDARIRRLGLGSEALDRLLVLNLRGRRLPLMTTSGRNWLVERLADHGTNLFIVDPFGAAYASAGGESENDNAEIRRFTTALDEVKRLAGVATMVVPVHTGRGEQEEGDERARGGTVIDDWPDVQMFLTKDKAGDRFLRTDGRAPFRLHESRLGFAEDTGRLMLAHDGLGVSRSRAREEARIFGVVSAVRENPGINGTDLKTAIHDVAKNNDDKAAAIRDALDKRLVHWHPGPRQSHRHYAGESHLEEEECMAGWTP